MGTESDALNFHITAIMSGDYPKCHTLHLTVRSKLDEEQAHSWEYNFQASLAKINEKKWGLRLNFASVQTTKQLANLSEVGGLADEVTIMNEGPLTSECLQKLLDTILINVNSKDLKVDGKEGEYYLTKK